MQLSSGRGLGDDEALGRLPDGWLAVGPQLVNNISAAIVARGDLNSVSPKPVTALPRACVAVFGHGVRAVRGIAQERSRRGLRTEAPLLTATSFAVRSLLRRARVRRRICPSIRRGSPSC